MESAVVPKPPIYEVTSAVEIQAAPEDVWDNVIAFAELPKPEDWVFRFGIASSQQDRLSSRSRFGMSRNYYDSR
jgi:hypothetical protein